VPRKKENPTGLAVNQRTSSRRIVEQRLSAPVSKRIPLKQLTDRERRFVQEFVANDGAISVREAAIRAGYSEHIAKSTGRDLTDPARSPHVVAAIQEYRRELNEKYGTTFERHMRDLQRIRDAALQAGAYGAAVSAEYRRGQALGTIYVDRKEIRVGTIDSMSREEVAQKLREIKAMFVGGASQEIIDVDPIAVQESVEREISQEPDFDPDSVLETPAEPQNDD